MERPAASPSPIQIAPETSIGAVSLTVSDLARSRAFYEQVLGLTAIDRADGTLGFGTMGDQPLVVLSGDSSAGALDRRATGLYHLAILVPTRADLGFALARVAQAGWRLDGASDHLVSEALYLSDPDGNGIEIYRDRPREQWRRTGEELEMATLPLDLEDVLSAVGEATELQRRAPPATTIGHVHLQVANLQASEAFYHELLGFDVTVRTYPGALFLSAGGYHHHIGLNTWHSAERRPPPPGAVGLRWYEIVLPSDAEYSRVLARVRDAGIEVEAAGPDGAAAGTGGVVAGAGGAVGAAAGPGGAAAGAGGWLVRDPSGIGVVLRTAA